MIQNSTLLSKSLKIPKGVIRSSNSKKRKSTNNGLQKHYTKKKDWARWTPHKTGSKLRCSRRVSSSCSTSGTRHINLVTRRA